MKSTQILAAASLAAAANAQSPLFGQCGGNGWNGATTCVAGSYCSVQSEWYSQCLPGSAPGGSTTITTARPTTLSTTTTSRPGSTSVPPTSAGPAPTDSSNPLAGKSFYVNNYYASEVQSIAIPSLIAAGQTALVPKASAVAKVPSFYWMDTRAKIPRIEEYGKDAAARIAAGEKLTVPLVVYNLPNRDCAAAASNGELQLDQNGAALYRTDYIDKIKAQLQAFPTVHFTLAIEPDSLGNLVTNMNVAKCSAAAPAYRELTSYAIKTLDLPNVSMYLDAGHAGWLGWPANQAPAAKLFGEVFKAAGSPKAVRGLVTNVSNYNAYKIATCPAYAESNTVCDESRFINALAPLLRTEGFPAHFLVDTGRSGVQPTKQQAWGNWCNVVGTGFGRRPSTATDDPLLDAWVWVKPGGESDGTSDTTADRYDHKCGSPDALKPAPEAGHWFQEYFVQLLQNANPAF